MRLKTRRRESTAARADWRLKQMKPHYSIMALVAAIVGVAMGVATAQTSRSAPTTNPAAKSHPIVYYICGKVTKAGEYSKAAISLKEALTNAEPSNSAKYVRLIRSEQGKPESAYDVTVEQLSNEPDANRALINNDQVLVSDSPFPDLDANQQEVVDEPTEEIVGEYYVGGHVERNGVYSLTRRHITLREAIMIAGGPDDDGKFVRMIHKDHGISVTSMKDVFMPGSIHNPYLQLDDQIMVTRDAPQPAH